MGKNLIDWLTLTLDVFKYNEKSYLTNYDYWLTLTLDVFKSNEKV